MRSSVLQLSIAGILLDVYGAMYFTGFSPISELSIYYLFICFPQFYFWGISIFQTYICIFHFSSDLGDCPKSFGGFFLSPKFTHYYSSIGHNFLIVYIPSYSISLVFYSIHILYSYKNLVLTKYPFLPIFLIYLLLSVALFPVSLPLCQM